MTEIEKDVKDTELYRSELQNRILRELCRKWFRVAGTTEIAELDGDELAKKWDVPGRIIWRVIQEMIDEGLLECEGIDIRLTREGRKECKKRKFG